MLAGWLIALAVAGPAGHGARPATDAPAVIATVPRDGNGWGPDLKDPFDGPARPTYSEATAARQLDLKDPFQARDVPPRDTAAEAATASTDLRDPFAEQGSIVGDEPGCTPRLAANGAVLQRPAALQPRGCDARGRPHLVNPFTRGSAR